MKINRTVSVAGECFVLPFMAQNNWVVDADHQKVTEATTAKMARWLAQVLNERFHIDVPQETL